jgi:predicted ATPase
MREMLTTCHRKQCIWYDYRESSWCYDLDRVFKHFEGKSYHETLNSEFITSRLSELPPPTRSILAWASLIGTSFSFELIQRLLSGEFDYEEPETTQEEGALLCLSQSPQDAVEGLQVAIQNYIIIQTQDDDRFRFAHDRYVQAARSMCGRKTLKMHFIIAQTLLKYYSTDERTWDIVPSHICASVDIINQRVVRRQSLREVLFDCAQSAAESGARPTAVKYYSHCFELLQADPWTDGATDVSYDETLELYTRAAECYLYIGQYGEAKRLLQNVFRNAKTPVDKAPAWVLQSRLFAQEGDSPSAFQSLYQCLGALDIRIDENPTFEKCDAEFEQLSLKLQSMDTAELVSRKMPPDSNLAVVGSVLVETISAAFWSDTLTVCLRPYSQSLTLTISSFIR